MDASNALIKYESGQNLVEFELLEDQGDHKDFRSIAELWSKRSGYAPNVKPNGLETGGRGSVAASGSNDVVDVAALSCYLVGEKTSIVAAADTAVTRPTGGSPANTHNKSSVTISSAGAIAVVKGTDGTSFSNDRGAAGGPPWIPTGSIELFQVWLSSATPAPITASEIKQVPGTHQERYDYPLWQVRPFNVENRIIDKAGIVFDTALPQIHSDDAGATTSGKAVYVEYYEPDFAEASITTDFKAPGNTNNSSSVQVYGRTIGSSSTSLNQGSFTYYCNDGISDGILDLEGEFLFFKFYQDRNASPYVLSQGKLGVDVAFPPASQITSGCTITAEESSVRVIG